MTNNDIQNAYMGVSAVTKICLGEDVVWPTTPPVYSAMPLTFEVIKNGNLLWVAEKSANTKTIQYNLNNTVWTNITSSPTRDTPPSIYLRAGDTIQFRGNNNSYANSYTEFNYFSGSTGLELNVKGNIMSLIQDTNYSNIKNLNGSKNFYRLFQTLGIISAENLVLAATGLTQDCYASMFTACRKLQKAPELPATILAANCYYGMFVDCSGLTKAPELPAAVLKTNCYRDMFKDCTSLNYIKCLATSLTGLNTLTDWVYNVSPAGTFVKHPDTAWTTGVNGIPEGWTVEDADI